MDCLQGVKQSDVGVKVGDPNVNCLLYADDAVPIASSECELQTLVTTLKEGCKNDDLRPNASNIKVFERNDDGMERKIRINEQKRPST